MADKIFLRVGAWYRASAKQMPEDIDMEDIIANPSAQYPIIEDDDGGGSGMVLESYQNAAMSAAVQAYVFRDADDNIVRVFEPIRGNDIQGAFVDFPFDNVAWEKNIFMAGASITDVGVGSIMTGCVLHPKALISFGGRSCNISDSFLDSRAQMYIVVTGKTVVSAVMGSQSKLSVSGDVFDVDIEASAECGWFGNGGGVDFVSINTGTKTFKLTGDVVANVKSIIRVFTLGASNANEGFYSVVSATLNTGNTDVVVTETIPTSTIGETQVQLISVFDTLDYVSMRVSSFLLPTTDLVTVDTVDMGPNTYYEVTGNIEGKKIVNIGGSYYDLGVTDGAVTAIEV